MRLNKFLNENINYTDILKNNCINNLQYCVKTGFRLYRGIGTSYDFIYDEKSKRKTRIATDSPNYYNIYFSELSKKWQQYPKRNKSLICSTNYNVSNKYGYVYIVIPFDNCKLGICNNDDLWNSFNYMEKQSTYRLNRFFNNIFTSDCKENKESINKFLDITLDEYINNKNLNFEYQDIRFKKILSKLYSSNIKLYDILEDLCDPQKNNIKLTKNLKDIKNNNVEIWFDDSAILLNADKYILSDILREIN